MFVAWCAFVMGLFFIVGGITHFLMPREQIHFATGIKPEFFKSLNRSSKAFTIHYWAFVIVGLAGASVVLFTGSVLGITEQIFLKVAKILGVSGFLVFSLNFNRMLGYALNKSSMWDDSSGDTKETILSIGLPNLDPSGLFTSGLTGTWFIIFNITAINQDLIPIFIGVTGLIGGFFYLVVFLGINMKMSLLVDIGAGLGGLVLAPIWCFGLWIFILNTI